MDFRQYDITLGRFTYIDKLTESAFVESDKNKS